MTKLTKTLLGLALTGLATGLAFVAGVINVQDNVALYVALPAGAIIFGLFLVSNLLEKETALLETQTVQVVSAPSQASEKCCCGRKEQCASKSPAPVLAHSH